MNWVLRSKETIRICSAKSWMATRLAEDMAVQRLREDDCMEHSRVELGQCGGNLENRRKHDTK